MTAGAYLIDSTQIFKWFKKQGTTDNKFNQIIFYASQVVIQSFVEENAEFFGLFCPWKLYGMHKAGYKLVDFKRFSESLKIQSNQIQLN